MRLLNCGDVDFKTYAERELAITLKLSKPLFNLDFLDDAIKRVELFFKYSKKLICIKRTSLTVMSTYLVKYTILWNKMKILVRIDKEFLGNIGRSAVNSSSSLMRLGSSGKALEWLGTRRACVLHGNARSQIHRY